MNLLSDLIHEFRKHKQLCEKAIHPLSDEQFFRKPAEQLNSIALIVKHIAGNLISRWTDFLTTDGEKPWRNRDGEFHLAPEDTRGHLMESWEKGWDILFVAILPLQMTDLDDHILIRGETLTVLQGVLRALTHIAYHTGQILYLARMFHPEGEWLTVAPRKVPAS